MTTAHGWADWARVEVLYKPTTKPYASKKSLTVFSD